MLLLLPIFALPAGAVAAQGGDDQSIIEVIIDWLEDLIEPEESEESEGSGDQSPPDGEGW